MCVVLLFKNFINSVSMSHSAAEHHRTTFFIAIWRLEALGGIQGHPDRPMPFSLRFFGHSGDILLRPRTTQCNPVHIPRSL